MKGFKTGAIAAALVLIAAVAVAGCGGGDDSSSSTTTALSKEEFLKQGNQICADGNKTIDAASQDVFSGGKPSQSDIEAFVTDTLLPTVQTEVDGIRALGAPEGDEDQVTAIVDSAQQAIDDSKADPSLIATNSSNDPFADTNKLANAYGLTECGS
jgi:hypothetical protein